MKYTFAVRLKKEDRKKFNHANFLSVELEEEGNIYSIGGRIYQNFKTYDQVLNFISSLNPTKIKTEEIEKYNGEFIIDFSPIPNQFFISERRPDNFMFWEDLRDSLYL